MSLSPIWVEPVSDLTTAQQQLLRHLALGHHLKGQRDIDGQKIFQLYHTATNKVVATPTLGDIEALRAQGLLASNMKFPAARFFLSPAGHQRVQSLRTCRSEEP